MKNVKVYYADIKNMGDQLNQLVIRDYFGYETERCSFLKGQISGIGSGLSQYQYHGSLSMRTAQMLYGLFMPEVKVWGTGFINYEENLTSFFKKGMEFCAVRGELSRRRAERIVKRSLDIPTGDGGILVSELLKEYPLKQYDIGIIPHICDRNLELVNSVKREYGNCLMIDVSEEPYTVLKQIASCETIISSSLHGLIAADSFMIPNRHVIFSDLPLGDGFKFDDYYSAYHVDHLVTDVRNERVPTIREIQDKYLLTAEKVAQKKMIMKKAFPYPIVKKI